MICGNQQQWILVKAKKKKKKKIFTCKKISLRRGTTDITNNAKTDSNLKLKLYNALVN